VCRYAPVAAGTAEEADKALAASQAAEDISITGGSAGASGSGAAAAGEDAEMADADGGGLSLAFTRPRVVYASSQLV
jgi:hypothetical protein